MGTSFAIVWRKRTQYSPKMIFPRVTIHLLLVAFPSVFSQYDTDGGDDGGVGAGDGGGDGSNCECSDITLNDGNSGKNIGNCLTSFNGKFWCYVSSTSLCTDKKPAARAIGLFYSSKACSGKFLNEPRPAVNVPRMP